MTIYSEQFYGVRIKPKQGRILFQRDYLLKKKTILCFFFFGLFYIGHDLEH